MQDLQKWVVPDARHHGGFVGVQTQHGWHPVQGLGVVLQVFAQEIGREHIERQRGDEAVSGEARAHHALHAIGIELRQRHL